MPGISFPSRSPLFAYILLQICFWAFLHIFLSLYLYLGFRFISGMGASVSLDIFHILAYALFFALFHGVILGIISYFVDKLLFIAKSAGRIIALQIVVSIVVFIITFEAARDYTSDRFLPERAFSQETWRNLFYRAAKPIQFRVVHCSAGQPNLSEIWSRCVLAFDDGSLSQTT